MSRKFPSTHTATQLVWAGETDPPRDPHHASQPPLYRTASFSHPDLDEWLAIAAGRKPGHNYTRNTNPTVQVFEEKVRVVEGAEAATAFSTGMAAVSGTLFALLKPGDRVVSIRDSYGGTSRLFLEFLPRIGVHVTLCHTTDHAEIEAEIAKGCRLLYLETPTNPTLKVVDIKRLAKAGHKAGAIVVTDNTFATPVNCNPLALGADLVVHSATKYLGGHEDAMGGVLCGKKDLVEEVFRYREITGASLAPDAAYLLFRGMKTLALRVRQQNASALAIATFLSKHPRVASVHYPGLPTDPGFEIARRQMRGFGGLLSFQLPGGLETVGPFLQRLQFAQCAPSLGGVQTYVGPPATTSHVECTPAQRAKLGIPEGLLRYSVGIEETSDLIDDLRQALEAVRVTRGKRTVSRRRSK
ncbi:MAG: cystathionine gamma-synthase family protein [Gemmatimonadaceae bacterium]